MSTDFVDSAVTRLRAAGLFDASDLRGCTDGEIQQIEIQYHLALPSAYRRLLEKMGKSAGEFLVGTDFFFPKVLQLREQAEQLLGEMSAPVSLQPADFVFAVHQGYEFLPVQGLRPGSSCVPLPGGGRGIHPSL